MSATYTISQAQAKLPKLVKRDAFTITCDGQVVGAFLSRDRIEALVETMELLADPGFQRALKAFESGRMKFYSIEEAFREDDRPDRAKR